MLSFRSVDRQCSNASIGFVLKESDKVSTKRLIKVIIAAVCGVREEEMADGGTHSWTAAVVALVF